MCLMENSAWWVFVFLLLFSSSFEIVKVKSQCHKFKLKYLKMKLLTVVTGLKLFVFTFILCVRSWSFRSSSLRYRSITKQFFRKADGVVVMYDVTAEPSFTAVRHWLTSVKVRLHFTVVPFRRVSKPVQSSWRAALFWRQETATEDIPIMLLGNKTDKEAERKVERSMGERLAKVCSCSEEPVLSWLQLELLRRRSRLLCFIPTGLWAESLWMQRLLRTQRPGIHGLLGQVRRSPDSV